MDFEKITKTWALGQQAWRAFSKGMETTDWADFVAMLTEDFEFYFPQGEWKGLHHGKAKAEEYFALCRKIAPEGFAIIEVMQTTVSQDTVVYEFKDEAMIFGNPYKNRAAISWTFRGEQICSQREYFGSDGKSY